MGVKFLDNFVNVLSHYFPQEVSLDVPRTLEQILLILMRE